MRQTVTFRTVGHIEILKAKAPLKRFQQRRAHDEHAPCCKKAATVFKSCSVHDLFHSCIVTKRVRKFIEHDAAVRHHSHPLLQQFMYGLLPAL